MEALIGSWVFLGIYGLAHVAFTWLLARWYYDSEIGHLRRALIDLGELLHKTNEEMASTRKLNVELARANEQLNEQIHNQIFTIEAFQKRETLLDKASRDIANKAMQLEEKVKTQTLTISNLQLGYDRCQEAFRDLSIHLNDMAYEIASVAPDAKGD